jgi:cytoskeletal protein RodZ
LVGHIFKFIHFSSIKTHSFGYNADVLFIKRKKLAKLHAMSNLSPQDKQTLNDYKGMSVGEIFRKSRETKGYNLNDIALHLNISSTHLEAIEADDYNALPQKVYAVGFVRAYANVLGLDSEKMAYLFKIQAYGKKQTDEHKQFLKPEGKEVSLRDTIGDNWQIIPILLSFVIIVGGVIALLYVLISWLITPSDEEGQIRVPEVPASMLEQSEDPFIVPATNVDTPQTLAEPMDIIVRPDEGGRSYGVDALEGALALKVTSDTSVEIMDVQSGQALFSQIFNKGDVIYLAEDQDVLISSTNAGAIVVYLDNLKLGLLGNEGQEIRLRPLSVKALRLQRDG